MAVKNTEKRTATAAKPPRKPAVKNDAAVGAVLRSAYQHAVEEAIPQEMLDLLGQLR